MDKIGRIIQSQSKYRRLSGPLLAAEVCAEASSVGEGRFGVISFKNGLLTLSVASSSQAADLHANAQKIINQINQKLKRELVKDLKFKIQ